MVCMGWGKHFFFLTSLEFEKQHCYKFSASTILMWRFPLELRKVYGEIRAGHYLHSACKKSKHSRFTRAGQFSGMSIIIVIIIIIKPSVPVSTTPLLTESSINDVSDQSSLKTQDKLFKHYFLPLQMNDVNHQCSPWL